MVIQERRRMDIPAAVLLADSSSIRPDPHEAALWRRHVTSHKLQATPRIIGS
jgi:hypothetical protein